MPDTAPRSARSISEVVRSGLCIGCGLCAAVTSNRVPMEMTAAGSLRPANPDGFTEEEARMLQHACPGISVEPRPIDGATNDLVWGTYLAMRYAWAARPDVRFKGATAGVCSALGAFLVSSGRADFLLHVGPAGDAPMRNQWYLSESPDDIVARAGSRYGPVAPLAGLIATLDRGRPFAIAAKPCDMNAVHRFGQLDPRVNELCVARISIVCGGQSHLTKSQGILDDLGVQEDELTLFRYRGHGNPGLARIETRDGRAFEMTYNELWADESRWDVETRCKVCPDALGEAADIVVADVWPNGTPAGEDAGFSGVVVRSQVGAALLDAAIAAGEVIAGDPIDPRRFDAFQPHQVRKKRSLKARFEGLSEAGLPIIDAPGLRIDALGQQLDSDSAGAERDGMIRRVRDGRVTETIAAADERFYAGGGSDTKADIRPRGDGGDAECS